MRLPNLSPAIDRRSPARPRPAGAGRDPTPAKAYLRRSLWRRSMPYPAECQCPGRACRSAARSASTAVLLPCGASRLQVVSCGGPATVRTGRHRRAVTPSFSSTAPGPPPADSRPVGPASQILTVWSALAEAIRVPSGENATDQTGPECPRRTRTPRPIAGSQIRTVRSRAGRGQPAAVGGERQPGDRRRRGRRGRGPPGRWRGPGSGSVPPSPPVASRRPSGLTAIAAISRGSDLVGPEPAAGGHVPEHHEAVGVARDHGLAVRAEGDGDDLERVPLEGADLPAGVHIPELDGPVVARRGQDLAVRAERHRVDGRRRGPGARGSPLPVATSQIRTVRSSPPWPRGGRPG